MTSDRRGKTGQWAKWIRHLRALPETHMRRDVLLERLPKMAPVEALEFFSQVMDEAAHRKADSLVVLDAIHEAILLGQQQGVLYELLTEVYRLARDQDRVGVVHLLLITKPQCGPLAAKEVPTDAELGRLPLGERKFLARGHNRLRLDRLLLDPEPSVLQNLLRNPHITEKEVIRLAARRPTRAEIQKEIYQSRFGERYRVRLALVFNPYTPTDLSVKLLAFLLKKDLNQAKLDANLHSLVREEAKRLLSEKSLDKHP